MGGTVGGAAASKTNPYPTAACANRNPIGIAHRFGVTAADTLASPTITAAKDDAHVGVMAAASHNIAVAVGTCYGYATRSDIVAITPTENKCVLLTIPQVVGAESYVIFFGVDAAPKRLAEITEAQRAAGCTITAVETVGAPYAGQAAGTVTLKLVGTGADTAAAIYATNLSLAPVKIAIAGATSSGVVDCAGYPTAYVRVKARPGALTAVPSLTAVPFVQINGKWAPGTPGVVTAGQLSDGFTANVGGGLLVVAVKSLTAGALADIDVELGTGT